MGWAVLLLGVKSVSGVPWLVVSVIGCGFVMGGGWWWPRGVGCVFLLGEETHRERKRCLMNNKKEL